MAPEPLNREHPHREPGHSELGQRGRFITLEGGDGTGKSTQTRRLGEALAASGFPILTTREPGGSPGAEEIRRLLTHGAVDRWDPITEALLHCAARRDHVRRTIEPALSQGLWVISDRFADSTRAYQGYGQGVGRDVLEPVIALAVNGRWPDLTIILDLPPEVSLNRARQADTGGERYERMGMNFHRRLRNGFLDIAAREPGRCVVVDADGTADQAALRIWDTVRHRFDLASPDSGATRDANPGAERG